MSGLPERFDPDDWQPATSRPGELYTIEGQVRATNAFIRGIKKRDPRLREYRRSMRRAALAFAGLAALIGVIIGVAQALL